MKTNFTESEFDLFVEEITNKGYRKYNGSLNSEDYYFCKAIFKTFDLDGDSRAVAQLLLSVYDMRNYASFESNEKFAVELNLEISRNSSECNSIKLDSNLFETLLDVEEFSFELYNFFDTKLPYIKQL